jgi:P-type conjugative transfer protein TrbJ
MTRIPKRLARLFAAAALIGTFAAPEANGLIVFDPANYQQNLLSAVHALEGVQNQVLQLQNEAAQLMRMDRQLQPLSGSPGPDLQSTLTALRARIAEGSALALKVQETEAGYARLYPTTFSDALSSNDLVRTARARWDEAYAGFKRAALLQGQVNEATGTDARLLDQILARSTGAIGSLQAAQAGNELAALHIKQSLQLQTLLAAQARAETSERARTLVAEEQGRAQVKTFLGDGRAYTRGQ